MSRAAGSSAVKAARQFFKANAGFSYGNGETQAQGRDRCARKYAAAERQAKSLGCAFEWSVSDIDSSDFSDFEPAWQLYDCLMRDSGGKVMGSLSGCDFGPDNGPYGNYRRVVEAEIALEALA